MKQTALTWTICSSQLTHFFLNSCSPFLSVTGQQSLSTIQWHSMMTGLQHTINQQSYNEILLRPMSHLQFYRVTLSRNFTVQQKLCDKIASVTMRVAQLFNSHATPFPNTAVVYSV